MVGVGGRIKGKDLQGEFGLGSGVKGFKFEAGVKMGVRVRVNIFGTGR